MCPLYFKYKLYFIDTVSVESAFLLLLSVTVRMTSSTGKLDDSFGPDSSVTVNPQPAGQGVDYEMESNGKAYLSGDSSENLPTKENRITKKAHRTSNNGDTTEAVAANGVQDGVSKHGVNVTHKSHRRRRHARGRIQLKKGNILFNRNSLEVTSYLDSGYPVAVIL